MPPAAANANQQIGSLQRFISARTADRKVTKTEATQILAKAKEGGVQVGELALLRTLAGRKALAPAARDSFEKSVDQIVPDGAPTARLAAILFRLDPATGRKQLLDMLDAAKNPVAGGPKTFVIRDGGTPYMAAITTGQVITGLTKFMKGASPSEARHIRSLLREQLKVLQLPVSQGGLRVPGLKGDSGLALAAQTAQGPILAVNQSAFVLKALEKVVALPGAENAQLAARARGVADKVATELKADLAHAYPSKGPLAYGFLVRDGRAVTTRLEDGDHLITTLDALKGLDLYKAKFAGVVTRMETRHPELKFAGAEDLNGEAGRVFTTDFNAFRSAVKQVDRNGVVNEAEAKRLIALAQKDGLRSPGEKALIARAISHATAAAKIVLEG